MADYHIRILEQELQKLGKSHLDILEWGSGGSTVYFPVFLNDKGISCTWTSVEHSHEWFDRVVKELDGNANITVNLVEYSGDNVSLQKIDMNRYIKFPASLGHKYDFILVDGRKRYKCLLEASRLLKPDGVVILHDAHRHPYYAGFEPYNDGRFLDYRLWRGSLRRISFWTRMANTLNYIGYRYLYRRLPPFLRKVLVKFTLRRRGIKPTGNL